MRDREWPRKHVEWHAGQAFPLPSDEGQGEGNWTGWL
jgi:hypothetical protein